MAGDRLARQKQECGFMGRFIVFWGYANSKRMLLVLCQPERSLPLDFKEAVYPFIDDSVIPSTIRVPRAVNSDPTMTQGTNYSVRTVRRKVI